jgi:hypothetical protein
VLLGIIHTITLYNTVGVQMRSLYLPCWYAAMTCAFLLCAQQVCQSGACRCPLHAPQDCC